MGGLYWLSHISVFSLRNTRLIIFVKSVRQCGVSFKYLSQFYTYIPPASGTSGPISTLFNVD